MGGLGTTEILIIVAIIVLFFGASKIPELARGLGEGIKEFRNVTDGGEKKNNINTQNGRSGSANANTEAHEEVNQANRS